MAFSRGKRATHSTTSTLLNSAGAGTSIAVTPGSVDGPRSTSRRETECFMCVIVDDVPNSGDMLRFTQEQPYLRISTKPQTPHVYIINIVVQIFIFLLKNVFFQDK